MDHPYIDDAGVIGILDSDAVNELPRAFVVKKGGTVITEEEIIKYIQGTFYERNFS